MHFTLSVFVYYTVKCRYRFLRILLKFALLDTSNCQFRRKTHFDIRCCLTSIHYTDILLLFYTSNYYIIIHYKIYTHFHLLFENRRNVWHFVPLKKYNCELVSGGLEVLLKSSFKKAHPVMTKIKSIQNVHNVICASIQQT